jgi:hypothetical protein
VTPRRHDERFDQLLALARDGDDAAVHDLWAEYGYDATAERRAAHRLPQPEEQDRNPKQNEKEK